MHLSFFVCISVTYKREGESDATRMPKQTQLTKDRDVLHLFRSLKKVDPKDRIVFVKFLGKKGVNGFRESLYNCLRGGFLQPGSAEQFKKKFRPRVKLLHDLCKPDTANKVNRERLVLLHDLLDPLLDIVIPELQHIVSSAELRQSARAAAKKPAKKQ